MTKGKRVTRESYELGKAMATMVKSSPYISKREKNRQIKKIYDRM